MKMSWGSLALHMEDSEPVGDIMRLLRLDEKLVIGNWGIKAEPSRLFPEHGHYMQIEIRGQRSKAKIGKKTPSSLKVTSQITKKQTVPLRRLLGKKTFQQLSLWLAICFCDIVLAVTLRWKTLKWRTPNVTLETISSFTWMTRFWERITERWPGRYLPLWPEKYQSQLSKESF